jgi:hypothetical protein
MLMSEAVEALQFLEPVFQLVLQRYRRDIVAAGVRTTKGNVNCREDYSDVDVDNAVRRFYMYDLEPELAGKVEATLEKTYNLVMGVVLRIWPDAPEPESLWVTYPVRDTIVDWKAIAVDNWSSSKGLESKCLGRDSASASATAGAGTGAGAGASASASASAFAGTGTGAGAAVEGDRRVASILANVGRLPRFHCVLHGRGGRDWSVKTWFQQRFTKVFTTLTPNEKERGFPPSSGPGSYVFM